MAILPLIQQKSLFHELVRKNAFEALSLNSRILEFIAKIWDIDLLPSTDPRFKTLRGDIQQHFVNNSDWDISYLFSEVLGLFQDETKFKLLIELIPSDEFQDDNTLVINLVRLINTYLLSNDLRLVAVVRNSFTYYEVRVQSEEQNNIISNEIPFFVEKTPNGRADKSSSHTSPTKFPALLLVYDAWDDFGVKSQFNLYFYPNENECHSVGVFKVIARTENNDEPKTRTKDYLKDSFFELSDSFCSLGQEREYYDNLKKYFPESYRNILWALKDCAIYSVVEDIFEDDYSFKRSLLRTNEAERLLREAKFLLEGIEVKNKDRFKYHFSIPFSEEPITLDVEFSKQSLLPGRVLTIVGKNGVGKTHLLSKLPVALAEKTLTAFEPQIPLFSKVISLSTSPYDHSNYPERTHSFNYEYIGLTTTNREGGRTIITDEEILRRLRDAGDSVVRKGRSGSLKEVLMDILSDTLTEELFPKLDKLAVNKLSNVMGRLSSGESVLLYLFTCIIASMRYDTLLLFDEPETHLHPNAITALMSALYKLLEVYQSYAIVVTHSPLVVREIKGSQVRIMDRIGDFAVIRGIQQETLGASISSLVDEIFGNKDIPKYYRKRIKQLVSEGYSENEIIRAITKDEDSLPLGLRVYIKSFYTDK